MAYTISIIFVFKLTKSVRFGLEVECYSIHLWWLDKTRKIPLKKYIIKICKQSLFTFVHWLWRKRVPCKSNDIYSVWHTVICAHHSIHVMLSKYRGKWCTIHIHMQWHMLCIHIINHCPFGWLFGIYFCSSLFEVHHILTTRLFYRTHNFLHRINNKKETPHTHTHSSIVWKRSRERWLGVVCFNTFRVSLSVMLQRKQCHEKKTETPN